MAVNTLARYTTIAGLSVPVVVTHKGTDKYGPVLVVKVTSTPRGQRTYRKGDILTVNATTDALSVR